MIHTIDFSYTPALTLAPASDEEEMMQNLYCLLNTTIAEVPCYRNFGLDKKYIAAPMNQAKTLIVVAIADALREFFPNLRLEKVDFSFDSNTPEAMGCRIEVADNYEES